MNSLPAFACAALFAAVVAVSADVSTTQPSDSQTKITGTRSRIVAPFNLLTDLTDDQKSQIRAIHSQTLLEEKELHDKERDEITAILTENQKKELEEIEARTSADKKAAAAQRRADSAEKKAQELQQQADAANASTTQPSGTDN